MSYTKGKWKIHKEILNSPQPEYIYGGPHSTHICDFRKLNPNLIDEVLEQQQANAKLIAAAPGLLAACKHGAMSSHHPSCSHGKRGDGNTCECHVKKCQDAVDKATKS